MAFCTNCGAQLPDGSKFCTNCGTKFEAPKPVQEMPVAPEQVISASTGEASEVPSQGNTSVQSSYTPTQGTYQGGQQQSYTPPAQQQSYTPPAQQQSYTPPAQQQSYQASGGYQAPQAGAQGYSAQPAYAPAAKAPKEKKPVNKKLLFIIGGVALAVILAVVLILVLTGKDNGASASSDPNLGIYNAATAEMWGMEMEVSDLWTNGFSIELKEKGKCSLNIDGTTANGKWTLEGESFHVKGGGVDCDGTLSKGTMVLEDVLGMGVTLTFEKEGGSTPGDTGNTGTNAPATGLPSGNNGGSDEANAIQQQWAGTWYGAMYVSEATGDFAGIPSDTYDVYMVVDVDAEGKGTFTVYLDGVDAAFATANCEAKEAGLYALDGTIAGGMEMYAYNWMFLPMRDYPDQYCMSDEIEDESGLFDFSLFMKQWGGSWQEEIDSNFAIVPPSVDNYNQAIANGELPPVGFAPYQYEGTAPASTNNSGSTGQQPTDSAAPETSAASTDYGKTTADADGIIPFDVMKDGFTNLREMTGYPDYKRPTYEEVRNLFGGVDAHKTHDSSWEEDYHVYEWITTNGDFLLLSFKVQEDGSETWNSSSWSSSLNEE